MIKRLFTVLFTLVLLFGCTNKQDNNSSDNNTFGDYSISVGENKFENITGKWKWVAKKDQSIIGLGYFLIKQNESEIQGLSVSVVPNLKSIKGKNVNSANKNVSFAMTSYPLNGLRTGEKLQFQVRDADGKIIKNNAFINSNGLAMSGKSVQFIDLKQVSRGSNNKMTRDMQHQLVYSWEATRVIN